MLPVELQSNVTKYVLPSEALMTSPCPPQSDQNRTGVLLTVLLVWSIFHECEETGGVLETT